MVPQWLKLLAPCASCWPEAGTAVVSQCLATGHSLFTGPIARAADGTDLSLLAGLLASAATDLLMMRSARGWS